MRNTICAALTAITLVLNALLRWSAEHDDKEKEQQ